MRKILEWKRDSELLKKDEYCLNNNIAEKVSRLGVQEISKKYTHIPPNDIEKVLKIDSDVWDSFTGIGIDLGGGVASVSSVVAKNKNVDYLYCLEVTESTVKKCQPIIIDSILGKNSYKVVSVIGDFNNIELEDSTLNFVVAWDSIHHSDDVVKTLREAYRVLKNQGRMIIVDRGHNNATSNKEIDRMLNVQYNKSFLKANFLPVDKVLTRRENGEHEYRFNQWSIFFREAGFRVLKSIIVKEKNKDNSNSVNDAGYKEIFSNFELGGYERKKVMYILAAIK